MMRFHQTQVSFHHELQNLQLYTEENLDHQLIMDTQQNTGKVEITEHINPEKDHQTLIMVTQGEGFDHQVPSLEGDFHDVHHHQAPLGVISTAVKAGTHLLIMAEIDHLVLEEDHPVLEEDHPVLEEDHPVLEEDHPVLEEDHPALEDHPVLEETIDQLANLRKAGSKIKDHQELVSRGNQWTLKKSRNMAR